MNEKNTLYIVVPCYKEQEVLPETSRRLREKMRQLMDEAKPAARAARCLSTTVPATTPGRSSASCIEQEPRCFPA